MFIVNMTWKTSTLFAKHFILEDKSINEALGLIKKNRPCIHLKKHQIKAFKIF
jgi:hypothetical protein